jgi:RNA polymerase sigma-70 factor, ECF subfamily
MANSPNLELDTVRILVSRIRDGDQSARSELATQVQSYLSMMADKNLDQQVRQNIGPSDVVQMTLLKMVEGIDGFRGESTPEFFGWLNQIVKNEARKASRGLTSKKRDVRRQQSIQEQENESRVFGGLTDQKLTPQSAALSQERIELFHLALSRLSDDFSTVIRLRNLEQLEFKEIAEKMNRTVNAVSKIWCRAILQFEKEMERLNEQTKQ